MNNISNILIVGGGTAGWMAACLMAHRWQNKSLTITLIESANIGTVGVGEGSTPFLRDFFDQLGIAETTWMAACDATYKCGIEFPGWCSYKGPSSYFHPFYGEADTQCVGEFFASCQQRREGFDTPTHPNDYFVNSYLAEQGKGPYKQAGLASNIEYGYHFDAAKLGLFLAEHARSLGVIHLQDEVEKVNASNEKIASIATKSYGLLKADFYVDATGLKGLLIQQTLGEKLISYQDYLPNNSAVAISTDYSTDETSDKRFQDMKTQTLSEALEHGWMWSIPLQTRCGNGYVYSDRFITKTEAEQRLRKRLGNTDKPALHLSWTPGRIEQHWKNNCLAVGLSQGFLEPLEAPMLNLIQQTCESFVEHFESQDQSNAAKQFNQTINSLIDGTRDYLQAHYLLNTRDDSEYWIKARENQHISAVLSDIIFAWDNPGSFEQALIKNANHLAYAKTSWYCIFAGKGRFTDAHKHTLRLTEKKHKRAVDICQKTSQDFMYQTDLLNTVSTRRAL